MVWKDVELALKGELSQVLLEKVQLKTNKNQSMAEIERLKNSTYSINAQVASLTIRLSELPSNVSAAPIYSQMDKLEMQKNEFSEKILELKSRELEQELPIDLLTYDKFMEVLRKIKDSGLTVAPPRLEIGHPYERRILNQMQLPIQIKL